MPGDSPDRRASFEPATTDRELLQSHGVHCPYCGESLEIDIDCSVASQSYIEDCQVCCRPMTIEVEVDAALEPVIRVRHEDE